MNIQKCARLSMLTALAIVLNILESFIPFFSIPGIKLGLANIITVSVLYYYGTKEAFYISILRVVIVGLLRTGLFSISFLFSITGAFTSLIMMILCKKIAIFSIVGISIIGSIFHSIGQILIAILLLKNSAVVYYLPIMIIISIITGMIIGLVSKEFVKYLETN